MTVDVGQTLDKYELMERVGQGGMAVVYRGVDTSLRREVAVKVLHRHLAESKEARDRFEREAQAVAKLRHENILEIFAFSGNDSEESYIVTEFIDGETLKDFVNQHEILFPEVGAMIAVQVCRALGHAHGLGVLHRDVKPENIMIRNDGVVKLTDFGISQMLDLQRMTVTGQLLGSPAYMSPEHVEGKGLDFRTDVFAVGIVLYQLVTGELPFKGKNPHEILKRIAECRFLPAEIVNPLVGKELGGILRKSLAREKEDRYADISQMLAALEDYLEGSGLSSESTELARFFSSPVSYELALHPRLVDHLARRGRKILHEDRPAALELFNRVLTLDPKNRQVLAEIDRLSRRRRLLKAAALFGGVLVVGAAALGARSIAPWGEEVALARAIGERVPADRLAGRAGTETGTETGAETGTETGADTGTETGADTGTGTETEIGTGTGTGAETGTGTGAGTGTETGSAGGAGTGGGSGNGRPVVVVARTPDAGSAEVPVPARRFRLSISPTDSEYRIGAGPWQRMSGRSAEISLPPGVVQVSARNEACCQERSITISADQVGGPLTMSLDYLPAVIVPECAADGVSARVDKRFRRLGDRVTIGFIDTVSRSRRVEVEFYTDEGVLDRQSVVVHPGDNVTVQCKP